MADINRRVLQGHPERQAIYEYIKAHRGLTTREIADALPYDRANTSMAGFAMCPACAAEYAAIRSRRYHAQPNCCPACGPRAFYLGADGRETPGDAIALAQQALAAGLTVAVKGTGGAVMAGTDIYGRGSSVSLTVTTVEDVACDTVNWYVNGAIAGTGKTFVYTPSGAPGQELEITARVQFSNGSQSFVQNIFVVHYKSWAAHPLFAILWTGLGIGVIAASVLIAMRVKSRKAQAAAAAQDAPAAVEEAEEKESPIRKK